MRPSLVSVVRMPMSSSWRNSILPKSVIERPTRGIRMSYDRNDLPLNTASSVPATTSRTSSVFTNSGSWPCSRIDFRMAFVDQYDGFFEITPILIEGPLHPRKEAMRFAGEKRVVLENRAVKAIFRDGYRPRRRELAVHPVVSERRQRQERPTIGVVEEVTLRGSKGDIRVLARIDTGAARTSLDTDLAARAGLGPVFDRVRVRAAAAHEPEERDVVDARVVIAGREFEVAVAIADRKDMRYHMIVGMDILRDSGFLVDPSKGNGRENEGKRAHRNP